MKSWNRDKMETMKGKNAIFGNLWEFKKIIIIIMIIKPHTIQTQSQAKIKCSEDQVEFPF